MSMMPMRNWLFPLTVVLCTAVTGQAAEPPFAVLNGQDDCNNPAAFELNLRYRTETAEDSGRFHTLTRSTCWAPEKTAVIVCDVWDTHTSPKAAARVVEMAPRINRLLTKVRNRGGTIIHAPSGCMEFYADHPARQHAINTPKSENLPKDITSWCYQIPPEEQGEYPLDQKDGLNGDDPELKKKFLADLEAKGRNPGRPWIRQIDTLTIEDEDYISDKGDEVWSILEQKGIHNVMLVGVHINMCVLGRPFGLRQMSQNGKRVVLCRDLTDTIYDPSKSPFVNHFTGTDLIVAHIEKWVAPTVTSDQFLGGRPFRFTEDKRPRLVVVMGEQEYRTNETLPKFVMEQLGKDYAFELVHANETDRDDMPGLEALEHADAVLVSVRRRALPTKQLARIREFIESGKPVIGIRTASHAFALRNAEPGEGHAVWPEFDREILGGNYTNHYGNGPRVEISIPAGAEDHPILDGVDVTKIQGFGSLYKVSPLASSATPLLLGQIPDQEPEPVAWVNETKHGGRVFYTALGHIQDFDQPAFNTFFKNGIDWALGR